MAEQIHNQIMQISSLLQNYKVSDAANIPSAVLKQIENLLSQAATLAGGDVISYLRDQRAQVEEALVPIQAQFAEIPGNAPARPVP